MTEGITNGMIRDEPVKLQKVRAHKLNHNRWQFRYVIEVPEDSIQALGWKEGSELQTSVKGGALVITPAPVGAKKRERVVGTRMSYEEFRDKVNKSLQYRDNGMTWMQIREQLKLAEVVPNGKWVRQMEKEIGLMRVKMADGRILWRINHLK